MRKYAKRSSRRPVRRPRRKPAYKSKKSFLKRKGGFRKKSQMSVIKVKNDGINQTFSKNYTGMTRWKLAMRKKYWIGAKNIYQYIQPYYMNLIANAYNGNQQTLQEWGYFNYGDMNAVLLELSSAEGVYVNPTGASGSVQNTSRVFFNKCLAEYVMTNNSNTPVMIQIYRFKCHRDTIYGIADSWRLGMNDEANTNTIDWSRQYGTSPLDCVKLQQYYKCVNITHHCLQPGQVHIHKHDIHLSTPINVELINNPDNATNFRSITEIDLIVAQGSNGVTSSVLGAGYDINIVPVGLSVVVNKRYEVKFIYDQNTSFKYVAPTLNPSNLHSGVYNQGSGALNDAQIVPP